MRALIRFFRKHPWQGWLVTGSLGLIIALAVAIPVAPWAIDTILIRQLCGDNPATSDGALLRLVLRGKDSEDTVRRLEAALETDDDARFDRIAQALSGLGWFAAAQRDPQLKDRLWCIRIKSTRDPKLRGYLVERAAAAGRKNRYVRSLCRTAAADSDGEVRARAATLAALLADDTTLSRLLADPEPAVRAVAALDAGIARRRTLTGALRKMSAGGDDLVGPSAVYALALLEPKHAAELLGTMIADCSRGPRLARLLHAVRLIDPEAGRKALKPLFGRCRKQAKAPPAMALVQAGELQYKEAGPQVRAVLRDATRKQSGLTEAQVLAALLAAERLDLSVANEVNAICTTFWAPRYELTMVAAARLLGRQIARGHSGLSRKKHLGTLRLGATFAIRAGTSATGPARTVTTPLASAAAAAALWEIVPAATYISQEPRTDEDNAAALQVLKIDRESSAFYLHAAADDAATLAGDYVAWHLARSGKPEAFETGLALLPPRTVPHHLRVYSNNVRSAGAMLLALSAKSESQRAIAIKRITSRLAGGPAGGEDDDYVAGAYRCALLMLGAGGAEEVGRLLGTEEFPQRRAITALLVAGDKQALDEVLWAPGVTDDHVIFLLIHKSIGEVFEALLPELPKVDPAAGNDVRRWQARILRDTYLIRRDAPAGGGGP